MFPSPLSALSASVETAWRRRHVLLASMDLVLLRVEIGDSLRSYRCVVRNTVTGEETLSAAHNLRIQSECSTLCAVASIFAARAVPCPPERSCIMFPPRAFAIALQSPPSRRRPTFRQVLTADRDRIDTGWLLAASLRPSASPSVRVRPPAISAARQFPSDRVDA